MNEVKLTSSQRDAIKRDAEENSVGACVGDTLRLLSDYAALEAECNELQRRLDAADEWATLASEQLKELDALAAELQALKAPCSEVPEVVAYRVSMPEEPELGHWFEEEAEEEPQIQHHDPLMTVAQHECIVAALKAQMAEPVAWMSKGHNGVIVELCLPAPDDERITLDWAPLYAAPPAAQDVSALPPFAEKVLAKLRRFEECAEDSDSGGVDIGRHWLDLLTQLALLNRVQRSPGLWEISQQGEDFLAAHRQAQQQEVAQCPKS